MESRNDLGVLNCETHSEIADWIGTDLFALIKRRTLQRPRMREIGAGAGPKVTEPLQGNGALKHAEHASPNAQGTPTKRFKYPPPKRE